jgi:hypothetical protein
MFARETPISPGTAVRLKQDAFAYNRPHLLGHARKGDVGHVAGPSPQSPGMSRLYVIIKFANCVHTHRVLAEEIEFVDGAA